MLFGVFFPFQFCSNGRFSLQPSRTECDGVLPAIRFMTYCVYSTFQTFNNESAFGQKVHVLNVVYASFL